MKRIVSEVLTKVIISKAVMKGYVSKQSMYGVFKEQEILASVLASVKEILARRF